MITYTRCQTCKTELSEARRFIGYCCENCYRSALRSFSLADPSDNAMGEDRRGLLSHPKQETNSMKPAPKLTRRNFSNWLFIRHHARFDTASDCSCPVARFLKNGSRRCPSVGSTDYRLDLGRPFDDLPLPKWAKLFIEKVDATGFGHITGRKALRILQTVR
jgi:hypothetical protein